MYQEQLKAWEQRTGKKRAELFKLTTYFDFHNGDQPTQMRDDTWSKTIKRSPFRREGKYNLYTILGIFFAFSVVSEADIKQFLVQNHIHSEDNDTVTGIPDDKTWNDIWQSIQEGVHHVKIYLGSSPQETSAPIESEPSNENDQKRETFSRRFIIIAIASILLLSSLGSVLLFSSRSSSQPCSPSGTFAAAPFLSDQGYSLHQADPNAPSTSILSNSVRSIAVNSQGLWVGYAPPAAGIDGVSYFDGKQWFQCPGLKLSQGQNVNGFAFQGNDVYLAIDGGNSRSNTPGVAELTSSGWKLYTIKDGLPSNAVYSVTVDQNNVLWATTYEGVAKLVEGHWKPMYIAQEGGLPCGNVDRFLEDTQGNLWFALVNCGISKLTPDGKWTSYFSDTDGIKNVRALVLDNEGGVWAATDGGGVVRFYNNHTQVFMIPQLPSNGVQDVQRDTFGRIWVATDHGIAFTPDYGKTWIIRSTLSTWGIAFGCVGCAFEPIHLWLIARDQGLGHARIPPTQPTVIFSSLPQPVQLHPGQKYIFRVEVQVLAEGLHMSDGDALSSSDPPSTNLYGAWPTIPLNQDEVAIGQKYTFSNVNNPIVAPSSPGTYRLAWRVWQGGRFVTDPIFIDFAVVTTTVNTTF